MGRTKHTAFECKHCGSEFRGHPDTCERCKKCGSRRINLKAYRCLGCDEPTYEEAGIMLVKGIFMVCSEKCKAKGQEVLRDLIH